MYYSSMGVRIPNTIVREVIRQWLQGASRDQIANDNQIGAGTVSAIIKECRQNDGYFDLLREVVLLVKKEQALDISEFAYSIRLKKKMNAAGLDEEQIESFIDIIELHCFRRGIIPANFVTLIESICNSSKMLGVRIDEIPIYIREKQKELQKLSDEIKEREAKKLELLFWEASIGIK
ncbi:MAG TPA: hypothetical protein VIP70_04160 [Nitrososphaeraceae archaeon]